MKFEDLTVGLYAEREDTVSEIVVVNFADVSGDHNPVHLDAAYAAATQFKERIVHGALLGAYMSALIGMKVPGPGTILASLTFRFRKPVKLGATVRTRVQVMSINTEKRLAKIFCASLVNNEEMVTAEALVYVPPE